MQFMLVTMLTLMMMLRGFVIETIFPQMLKMPVIISEQLEILKELLQ